MSDSVCAETKLKSDANPGLEFDPVQLMLESVLQFRLNEIHIKSSWTL